MGAGLRGRPRHAELLLKAVEKISPVSTPGTKDGIVNENLIDESEASPFVDEIDLPCPVEDVASQKENPNCAGDVASKKENPSNAKDVAPPEGEP